MAQASFEPGTSRSRDDVVPNILPDLLLLDLMDEIGARNVSLKIKSVGTSAVHGRFPNTVSQTSMQSFLYASRSSPLIIGISVVRQCFSVRCSSSQRGPSSRQIRYEGHMHLFKTKH